MIDPLVKGGIMGEKWPIKFSLQSRLPRNCKEFLTWRTAATWDRRLYFPSEGGHAEDFSPEKSNGFSRV
jgi:hypothetical protein